MVKVRELARILNGVNGDFEVESVHAVGINFKRKRVDLGIPEPPSPISIDDLEPWNGESERFFPNMVGMDDDNGDYRTSAVESTTIPQNYRFFPQGGGWTEENEIRYKLWKDGKLEREEQNPDHGSNTIRP